MLPIAPPCLPIGHPNRHLTCVSALSATYAALRGRRTNGLLASAMFEGWSKLEARKAIATLDNAVA